MQFTDLPTDVILIFIRHLSATDLAALTRTCRFLHHLVTNFGWQIQLRFNPKSESYSLQKAFIGWDAYSQIRYHTITNRHWTDAVFVARPLSCKWPGKLQPTLAINSSRLFVAAGHKIYTYIFTSTKPGRSPGIRAEGIYTTNDRLEASRDITSLACFPDGGLDMTLCVGYADGALEYLTLPDPNPNMESTYVDPKLRDRRHYHGNDLVESISSGGDYILSLSSMGAAVFLDLASSSPTPQLLDFRIRSWSTYLSVRGSSPYAVFGTSSITPLVVHGILPSGLNPAAFAILGTKTVDEHPKQSAVYGITGAPLSSPWGSSDQIVVSGWYDGPVRVHDLRCQSRTGAIHSSAGPAPLLPVLSVYDPWLFEPNYTVSCGGGSSSFIAAGTARHSVVAFWDVRSPASGWSVHAPGNDSSPVYSVILEGSRLFGATQSRSFVLDFGPDLTEGTFPTLPFNLREEGLKKKDKKGIGFYVTKYSHSR